MKNSDASNKLHQKSWVFIAMVGFLALFINTINFASSSDNTNLGVSAHINSKCTFGAGGPSGSNIGFGTYMPITENETAARTSTGSFNTKCTRNSTSQIALNAGQNASQAVGTSRAMTDGNGNYLSYEIYSDSGRSIVWDESSTVEFTDPGGNYTTLPIYASIPPGQDVPAGEYSDSVIMTVSY